MQHYRISLLWLAVLIALVSGANSNAAVWYVDASMPASGGNGISWCSAFAFLQDALAVATAGDSIRVADGIYTPDRGSMVVAGDRLASFHLARGVAVRGGFAGCGASNPDAQDPAMNKTTLSGDLLGNDGPAFVNFGENSFHVVTASGTDTSTLLEGFTISSGHAEASQNRGAGIFNVAGQLQVSDCVIGDNLADFQGGGVLNSGSQPVFTRCSFVGNRALDNGGAVYNGGSTPSFFDCTFTDNSAVIYAGAICNRDLSDATYTRCTFLRNTASETGDHGGGAIVNASSSPLFTDCIFDSNRAITGRGGAMYNETGLNSQLGPSQPTLTGCSFTDNRAVFGGGVYNAQDSVANFTSCDFQRNIVDMEGGAFYVKFGTGVFTNCTFNENVSISDGTFDSNHSGSAIYSGLSSVSLSGCVVSNNTSLDYGGALSAINSDILIDTTIFTNNSALKGGAIKINAGSSLIVTRSAFIGNMAASAGGAIGVSTNFSGVIIANCSFLGNSAGDSGAIHFSNADIFVVNSIFVGNQAAVRGSAIVGIGVSSNQGAPLPATLTLHNCTLTGNSSSGGSSIWFKTFNPLAAGSLDVYNSILWDGPNQILNESGAAINISHSDVQGGWVGTGTIDLDPMFVNAVGTDGIMGTSDDNLRLLDASPAINAGNSSVLPGDLTDLDGDGNTVEPIPFDLDGGLRVVGSSVDLGAYESQSIGPCNPGQFSATGQDPCNPCPMGTFQSAFGQTACQMCTPGSAQASMGAISCDSCSNNTFQPNAGQATCLACTCDDGNASTQDSCDAVTGQCQNIPNPEVPAVSQWGLVVMFLVLLIFASLALKERVPASRSAAV